MTVCESSNAGNSGCCPTTRCFPYRIAQRMTKLSYGLWLAALGIACSATATAADNPQSQIWIVSTRSAPHSGTLDDALDCLKYWRRADDCQWEPTSAESFHESYNADVPTVLFIHGNRTDSDDAVAKGMAAYRSIGSCIGDRPMRFVIWSWPAEKMCRHVREDTMLKADYSDVNSYYLARWLNQMPPGAKISLTGHSFGPRIISGALHLLAGGAVACRQLPPEIVSDWADGKRNRIRAVLMAAAVDADWLAPGHCHGSALSLVEAMLITSNPCDRVLKWYPRMERCDDSQALGFTGPCGIGDADNVKVINVACTVGKPHDFNLYCVADNVCSRWAQYTFLDQ